jgi:hypothetical protein
MEQPIEAVSMHPNHWPWMCSRKRIGQLPDRLFKLPIRWPARKDQCAIRIETNPYGSPLKLTGLRTPSVMP